MNGEFSKKRLTLYLSGTLFIGSFATAAPLDTFRDCDVCPEMIELPVGEFLMGAPDSEFLEAIGARDEDGNVLREIPPNLPPGIVNLRREGPVHPVTIDIPIAMGSNEVTHDQWMACVNAGGCGGYIPDATVRSRSDEDFSFRMQATGTFPVMNVSYLDALTYVDWLNGMVGAYVYRLPTEAEWEYAARAGTQTKYAQGNDLTKEQARWNYVPSEDKIPVDAATIVTSIPVQVEKLDAANAWGLRHMSGNIREVTMSCWSKQHELWSLSSKYLEQAPRAAFCDRVVRGGSYVGGKSSSRSASRLSVKHDSRRVYDGFRVVREIVLLMN